MRQEEIYIELLTIHTLYKENEREKYINYVQYILYKEKERKKYINYIEYIHYKENEREKYINYLQYIHNKENEKEIHKIRRSDNMVPGTGT